MQDGGQSGKLPL